MHKINNIRITLVHTLHNIIILTNSHLKHELFNQAQNTYADQLHLAVSRSDDINAYVILHCALPNGVNLRAFINSSIIGYPVYSMH